MGHINHVLNKYNLKHSHGGSLRQLRKGRKARPLSSRKPHHVVFKADKKALKLNFRSPRTYKLVKKIIDRYAKRFFIRVEQCSINFDHIHLNIRVPRRAMSHYFLRVVAGQIAQELQKESLLREVTDTPGEKRGVIVKRVMKLWLSRPFTRVVHGWRAYITLRDYIQLNEKEVTGVIPYQKTRLRGLHIVYWQKLWSS
ncbi:hypothetical protein CIK05_14080 [Bdellovibrio sp. qaytius]|nr:hypothetical protein CIK05_14080 [Bdellovibrio sp. qaytius]